jgi:hypothetical protein
VAQLRKHNAIVQQHHTAHSTQHAVHSTRTPNAYLLGVLEHAHLHLVEAHVLVRLHRRRLLRLVQEVEGLLARAVLLLLHLHHVLLRWKEGG